MKNYLVASLVIGLLMVACKKKDSPTTPNRTDLLTTKAWKISQVKLSNGLPVTEALIGQVLGQGSFYSQFINSDVLFKKDNTYTATNRTNQQTINGEWHFNADSTLR